MTSKELANYACDNWFSYQNAYELEVALERLATFFNLFKRPPVIVEIGIANGATVACWAESLKHLDPLVIAIDPLVHQQTPEQKIVRDKIINEYRIKTVPYFSETEEAHTALENILGDRKIDFLFIDGDHRVEGVTNDFYTYIKYMNKPSIVGFHDIYHNPVLYTAGSRVREVWEKVKEEYNYDYDEWHFRTSMGFGFLYLS